MTCNVGGVDRIARVLAGIVFTLSALFFLPTPTTRVGALIVGILLFASAWYGFCFINRLLGVNTAVRKTNH